MCTNFEKKAIKKNSFHVKLDMKLFVIHNLLIVPCSDKESIEVLSLKQVRVRRI